MIAIAGIFLGAVYGWFRAGRAGGNRFDRWQYALVFAIIGAIIGLFATIAVERLS